MNEKGSSQTRLRTAPLALSGRPLRAATLCAVAGSVLLGYLSAKPRPAFFSSTLWAAALEGGRPPDGWTAHSPRDEIRPKFAYLREGGPDGPGRLVIEADAREGLMGWWQKTWPVEGGSY